MGRWVGLLSTAAEPGAERPRPSGVGAGRAHAGVGSPVAHGGRTAVTEDGYASDEDWEHADPFAVFLRAARVGGPHVRVVDKPWGCELLWAQTPWYAGKVILVRGGHALSLQYHREKAETHWYLQGSGVLQLDEDSYEIHPGLTVHIRPGQVHRVVASSAVVFLEVSTPQLDDVVRLQDRYGRTSGNSGVEPRDYADARGG